MTIPGKVKIGGKKYRIKITDNLELGSAYCSAEINYLDCEIRIRPASEDKMKSDFLHEVIHGVYDFLGYKNHNEKKIDELANALYMVIQDNPSVFKT